MSDSPRLTIRRVAADFSIDRLDDDAWADAVEVAVTRYWSGEKAPIDREFSARHLWTDAALYVRFEATQNEPLVVSEQPDLTKKTNGLWDRDVCEIFIAPDRDDPNKYFEFEIAPTGEWIDLAIEFTPHGRNTDLDYNSGMACAARIEDSRTVMAMKLPWSAFGNKPNVGDVWLGNLFRCVGQGAARGYLAWQPTGTPLPNFHVPEAFGEFVFRPSR